MIITRRSFILLSIFLSTGEYIRANRVDNQSDEPWIASRSVADGVNDSAEEVLKDTRTKEAIASIGEASRRSLAGPRVAFLTSPTITSGIVHQRIQRDAAFDDEAAAGFVSYGSVREDEDSLRGSRILYPWRYEGHVTKNKHGKHRRRYFCKKHRGCSRSDRRNKNKKNDGRRKNKKDNEKWNVMKPLEHRKWFQQQSRSNRNMESRVLVGNRPLALFRKELAAAAAANAAEAIATRKLIDQFLETESKNIDDIPADKISGRGHVTTLSLPITSSRNKNHLVKGKNAKRNKKKHFVRAKNKHAQSQRDKHEEILPAKVSNETTNLKNLNESLPIEAHPSYVMKNFTNMNERRAKVLKNETNSDILSEPVNEETTRTVHTEKTDKDFVDRSVIASIYTPNDDRVIIHESLIALLSKLVDSRNNSMALRDDTDIAKVPNEGENLSNTSDDENDVDVCQKWLDSKEKLEEIFLGPLVYLPACPCQYPSGIINDDEIWDKHQKKYFRWQDVSNESVRLIEAIHKPAVTYCIKSFNTQESPHTAVQHCCYDHHRRLLTRGSEAATPSFVSPEISSKLHEKIQRLPWRLCMGDFTRFNKVRTPNNDNRCRTNPEDEDYRL